MRIALVHPFAWPDVRRGGERYLNDLTWYFRRQGDIVDVITGTSGPTSRVESTAGRDVRLHHRSLGTLRRRGISETETFGPRALPHLLKHRYDVVHTLIPSAGIVAQLACQPTLFTLLGYPGVDVFDERPWNKRLFNLALKGSGSVAALTEPAAMATEQTFGRKPIVLPPGVRVSAFAPDLKPRVGPPRILFASALDQRQKGLDVLVRAFDLLLADMPDARLQLGGPGDGDWALGGVSDRARGAIDDLGPGLPEDLPRRYRQAMVTVLPSRHEAFGLVLVESLACGTPVIGATPGGPSDIVDDRVGRLVPHGDADALREALLVCIELARDPEVPGLAREHAKRWDWDAAVGPMHRDAYEGIARSPTSRPSRTV